MMNEDQSIEMTVKDEQSDLQRTEEFDNLRENEQISEELEYNICKEELFSSLIAIKKSIDKGAETKYEKFLNPALKEYRAENFIGLLVEPLCWAEFMLASIFQTGRNCQRFTEDEKRAIAELITSAIEVIKETIMCEKRVYRTRLSCSILQKRSALEYLKEYYADFPVGDTILINKLEEANIEESVTILEKIIEMYRYRYDSDEGETDREEAGANDVPEAHRRWWFNPQKESTNI